MPANENRMRANVTVENSTKLERAKHSKREVIARTIWQRGPSRRTDTSFCDGAPDFMSSDMNEDQRLGTVDQRNCGDP